MDKRLTFLAMALCLVAAASTTRVHAQTTVVNPGTADAARPVKTQKTDDDTFVERASAAGVAEVEAGKLAVAKGTTDMVRSLGSQMVTDHAKVNAELATLAKTQGITVSPLTDPRHQADLQRLQVLQGAEFDRAYIASQVADHEAAIALFRNQAEKGTNAQLKEFAARTLPTLQNHLQHVRQVEAGRR